jgi:dTDP-4-dehydrorhamnose reductase
MNVLILGKGYIGSYLNDKLKSFASVDFESKKWFNYTDVNTLVKRLLYRQSPTGRPTPVAKYDYVINCSGFTGRPNVDQGEEEKELCYDLNTFAPLRVSNICKLYGINYIHISSGCIYNGYEKLYTEEDPPNFGLFSEEASTYSKSKHAYELGSDYGLILRVRMPFCNMLHERSILTKLLNYDNLVSYVNSKTYIPDLVNFITLFIKGKYPAKQKEILNFVNPEPLSTDQVTGIMKDKGLHNTNWEWVHFEELNTKANRSNCILCTKKLEKKYGFRLLDEEVAIKKALANISI